MEEEKRKTQDEGRDERSKNNEEHRVHKEERTETGDER